ncbi:DUF3617 domain-containing protein [Ferrovum myxofaciens]|uniref:DUF3617 domain-containing protein n=3 Tax=root TaxID=1 RepID=A0A9E6MX51_9PROT|nr:DUF3617 domain-containing protein [Ferrovum myxofaciens]MBU6995234.1 DUF3617 domain-containing protein [Ferrovum myxofaciens]QKE39047.1 MAG: DUF3617 domain-containing protein [Ferrovum myxofaciens]QKE41605.1 MAG: DUF3617 domain-containing protein [Ferrovum myxofaciens]QWY74279.1 MAG: DUF3617 domain-containing protein [Ferrovum myxofaciens]QWY77028.1 MAG: DUF3617 domain-containing protein [Ferrovum myxofaciens]
MRQFRSVGTAVLIAAGGIANVSAWAELPMKPGLWEIQPTVQLPSQNGAGPMLDMSQVVQAMSPQMRSQMEALMQKQGVSMGANGGIRVCTTRDMIERNRLPQKNGCESSITSQSGDKYRLHFNCGSPPTVGEGEVVFRNSEAYTTRVEITHQEQGKEFAVTMESSAKWLGSDCGSLQPAP